VRWFDKGPVPEFTNVGMDTVFAAEECVSLVAEITKGFWLGAAARVKFGCDLPVIVSILCEGGWQTSQHNPIIPRIAMIPSGIAIPQAMAIV